MAKFLTVDGGTTNTQISLVATGEVADAESISLPEEQVQNLSALGAVRIYNYGK